MCKCLQLRPKVRRERIHFTIIRSTISSGYLQTEALVNWGYGDKLNLIIELTLVVGMNDDSDNSLLITEKIKGLWSQIRDSGYRLMFRYPVTLSKILDISLVAI